MIKISTWAIFILNNNAISNYGIFLPFSSLQWNGRGGLSGAIKTDDFCEAFSLSFIKRIEIKRV